MQIESPLLKLALSIDIGLLVLIWMVQIAVYPAFRHIKSSTFKGWHAGYTRNMGLIAGPLMIAQLGLALFRIYQQITPESVLYLVAVAGTWGTTFGYSVPLHKTLQARGLEPSLVEKLISTNWIRTILWSVIALRHLAPP